MKKFQRLSEEGVGTGLRWWAEIILVLIFYIFYSAIRNLFGSTSVSSSKAFNNAESIIDLEDSLGLFFELEVQNFFID